MTSKLRVVTGPRGSGLECFSNWEKAFVTLTTGRETALGCPSSQPLQPASVSGVPWGVVGGHPCLWRSALLCFGGQVLGLPAGRRAGVCGPVWLRVDPGLHLDGRGLLGVKGLRLYDASFSPVGTGRGLVIRRQDARLPRTGSLSSRASAPPGRPPASWGLLAERGRRGDPRPGWAPGSAPASRVSDPAARGYASRGQNSWPKY